MNSHWVKFSGSDVVIAEGVQEGRILAADEMFVDGRSDGISRYMGMTYDRPSDTFSNAPSPPTDPLEDLKTKDPSTWTDTDFARVEQARLNKEIS